MTNPLHLDLREFCRYSDSVETRVILERTWVRDTKGRLHELPEFLWMRLGQCHIRPVESPRAWAWVLSAFLDNATDQEHDAAKIVRFGLVGVTLESVDYSMTRISAWIRPDTGDGVDFRVPDTTWTPFADSLTCTQCGEPHPIVRDYLPPFTEETRTLFEKVRTRRLRIQVLPAL